jgi:hypothetical protein
MVRLRAVPVRSVCVTYDIAKLPAGVLLREGLSIACCNLFSRQVASVRELQQGGREQL